MANAVTKSEGVVSMAQSLKEFLVEGQTAGDLSRVILAVADASREISKVVRRAGLMSLLGRAGEINVQGEDVQKLDVYSDELFERIVGAAGEVFAFACEEREQQFSAASAKADAPFVVAYDPLDGSSNIDVNVSIGTIWAVFRRKSAGTFDAARLDDFNQGGRAQIAAGYTIYGSSTMLVLTTGAGVNGFTLDEERGEFMLTHPKMQMPTSGKIYSCNEGNAQSWSPNLQAAVSAYKSGEKPLSARYVGSLVADFHRTLLKGGVFFYPADQKNKRGKLRLLYECAPMAFVAEQAGGAASDGKTPILDLRPSAIHERVPLFIGSSEMVGNLKD